MIQTIEQKKSICKLFHVAVEDGLPKTRSINEQVKRGFIVLNRADNSPCAISAELFNIIDATIGMDIFCVNNTFHKSFQTVYDMAPEEFVMQQCLHYMSTYGMENMGFKSCPYIPVEALQIPEENLSVENISLIYMKSHGDLYKIINDFTIDTIAPSVETVRLFKPLAKEVSVPADQVSSFELRVLCYDAQGIVPKDPVTFLRFLVYKTTGRTLLIKNKDLIHSIKLVGEYEKTIDPMVYFNQIPITDLASIFFRYKPIFLAYKSFPNCKSYINKLRRLADRYHEPLDTECLQNLHMYVKSNDLETAKKIIYKASNLELVKIIDYFRNDWATMAVYNIRNGKSYVAEKKSGNPNADFGLTLAIIELQKRLTPCYKGKVFYLPEYISYAAPYSGKQFVGNFPWGTKVGGDLGDAITAGVSWNNVNGQRVDIDLHMNSATKHFGWNGFYTKNNEVIYTGDQTDATNGAAEAYWFKFTDESYVLTANLFSGPNYVPFDFFMSKVKPLESHIFNGENYTFNPADALFPPIKLAFNNTYNMSLGLFSENTFYFYGGNISSGVVPKGNYKNYIEALTSEAQSRIGINEIIRLAGGKVITSLDEAKEYEQVENLAPGNLKSTTLLSIVEGKYFLEKQ